MKPKSSKPPRTGKKSRRGAGALLAVILLAAALATAGCSDLRRVLTARLTPSKKVQMTEPELRDALTAFEARVTSAVSRTSRDIRDQPVSDTIRRHCLRWQIETTTSMRDVVRRQDTVLAFLQAWILCQRMRQAVEAGYYKESFGEYQPQVIKTAQEAVADIEQLAHQILTPSEFNETQRDVTDFARENPIAGTYSGPLAREIGFAPTAGQRFDEILNIPLAPFKPLEGVDRTAAAIGEFTVVADRFADIVEDWPEMMNWQAQMLALNLGESDTVESLQTSAARMAEGAARLGDSSESLARTAQELPQRLSDELSSREEQVSALLGELRDTTARLDQFVHQVDSTARNAAQAGEAWAATARAIQDMVAYFVSLKGEPAVRAGAGAESSGGARAAPPHTEPAASAVGPAAGGDGYDILDYEKTAVALTAAAAELRALTVEVRDLTASPGWVQRLTEVETSLQAAINQAALRADRISDHLAWRGAQLIVLAFVLALAYRWLQPRLRATGS
jgi:hypothetical protein